MQPQVLKALFCSVLMLGVTEGAFALPTFRILSDGFQDDNHNGLLDCGETFDLLVRVTDTVPIISPVVPAEGTITVPTDLFRVAWNFLPGTIALDPAESYGCTVTAILEGTRPADDQAVFSYQCVPDVPPPGGTSYALAVRMRGTYIGFQGPIQVVGEDRLTTGPVLTDTLTISSVTSCLPVDLALSKTDGGITVLPGQTFAYVLGYSSLGGAADNCVLRETVPANTTFNPSASSFWMGLLFEQSRLLLHPRPRGSGRRRLGLADLRPRCQPVDDRLVSHQHRDPHHGLGRFGPREQHRHGHDSREPRLAGRRPHQVGHGDHGLPGRRHHL